MFLKNSLYKLNTNVYSVVGPKEVHLRPVYSVVGPKEVQLRQLSVVLPL